MIAMAVAFVTLFAMGMLLMTVFDVCILFMTLFAMGMLIMTFFAVRILFMTCLLYTSDAADE